MRTCFIGLCLIALAGVARAEPALCSAQSFAGNDYSVCKVDLRSSRIELFNLDDQGMPLASFRAVAEKLSKSGRTLAFAMNAGMFDENLKPIGLYIEKGQQAKKLNRRDGYGNFHLKPNGVFAVTGDRLAVMASEDYVKAGLKPDYATQSGPMLVIDGAIHPKFSESGTSAKIRNGVGMADDHTAIFVISENAVTFYDFAKLFRDALHCDNALFFDGTVSSLYSPELGRNDAMVPLGPMVGAYNIQ
jgi:uncharacterized protein YigE (DUF2233 family)